MVAKWGAAMLRLYKGRENRRAEARPLHGSARDEEFEGAGDDAEFDGKAGEGLAIDLGVEGIFVERLADEGIGFEVVDACGAAEFSQPKSGQIAEIAEAAASCEGQDFEAVLEEIGFGGDFERAAVVLCAPDDDQRRVDFVQAADDTKMRELVPEDFADTFPPVSENADARFEAEVDGIDDHAVRSGASDAEKVFFLFRLFERGGQAESDFLDRATNEFFRGAGDVPGQIEFLSENVGGAARKKSKGNAVTVLLGGQAVDNFIERAVAAAGDDELAAFGSGAVGDFRGVTRAGGFRDFRLNTTRSKNAARLVQCTAAGMAAVASVGVVD